MLKEILDIKKIENYAKQNSIQMPSSPRTCQLPLPIVKISNIDGTKNDVDFSNEIKKMTSKLCIRRGKC